VLDAYRHGVFPWFDANQTVLWWSPDPRTILPLEALHVPRRLERTLRTRDFEIRVDRSFPDVVRACADRREGTWIHRDMMRCYEALHRAGAAHSLEVLLDGTLVGGIYGVAVGGLFAAESMFHRVRDASSVALVTLARRLAHAGYRLFDVQFTTPHLLRFGAREIPRREYLARLEAALASPCTFPAE
jgi:leucyl/phenylalanyl-tRNA--protein transferase